MEDISKNKGVNCDVGNWRNKQPEETTNIFDTVEFDTEMEPRTSENVTREENLETDDSIPRRSQRHRQPPVRYGMDEYADVSVEESVHHVTYQTCQIEEDVA